MPIIAEQRKAYKHEWYVKHRKTPPRKVLTPEERRGERWFVDATIGEGKSIDVVVASIFSRFARLGILFVGKEDSFLVEVGRFKGHAQVNASVIDAVKSHNGAVSIPPLSNEEKYFK